MNFENQNDKLDWSVISDLILSKNERRLSKLKNGLHKIKKLEDENTIDFKGITGQRRRTHIDGQNCDLKFLHQDSFSRKVLDLKIKQMGTFSSRKSVDGGRRFSKFSTHDPFKIRNLIRNIEIDNNNSVKESKGDMGNLPKLLSNSSADQQNEFQINIDKVSSSEGIVSARAVYNLIQTPWRARTKYASICQTGPIMESTRYCEI